MPLDQPPDCAPLIAEAGPLPGLNDEEKIRRWVERHGRAMECTRLNEAGWSPIAKVARQGREIRRATFNEGRLAFRIPAVALERLGRGVFISLSIDKPRRVFRVEVPPEEWRALVALDDQARRPLRKPPPVSLNVPASLSCHGWSTTIEGAGAQANWRQELHECNYDPHPEGFAYAYRLADLALRYIPECAAARERVDAEAEQRRLGAEKPVWGLIYCGGRFAPRTLSDP